MEITATQLRKQIGARIRLVREGMGDDVSQQELADMLRVSQDTVSAWERGARAISHYDLLRFCHVTGVTADYILFGREWTLPHQTIMRLRLLPKPD